MWDDVRGVKATTVAAFTGGECYNATEPCSGCNTVQLIMEIFFSSLIGEQDKSRE